MRRRGFVSTLNRIAREAAKAQRAAERREATTQRQIQRQIREIERDRQRSEREQKRLEQLSIREQKALEKEQKNAYIQSRKEEVADMNEDIELNLQELDSILINTLSKDDTITFDSLLRNDKFLDFVAPDPIEAEYFPEPNKEEFFNGIESAPPFLEKLFGIGKNKRLEQIRQAEYSYNQALAQYEQNLIVKENIRRENEERVKEAREKYEIEKNEFLKQLDQHNDEIRKFKVMYFDCEKDAVESYNAMVLERSEYNELFPQDFNLFYIKETKEFIVEYQLPSSEAVPRNREYKYVQSKDEIKAIAFKPKEINEMYAKLISSVTLRTIHEIFDADQAKAIESIVFNGVVSSINPETGLEINPCIITLQTTKSDFTKFDLSKVDVIACVKGMKANISPSVSDLAPVKPIVDFNMLDKRFISEKDMLSSLDDRTNLLEMDPFDFEHLVCNLFAKLGLESKLTRSSRDGGVDAIAFDPRPVFGGKYVIQAKRYRNVVEVAAVRDLYGTMMNENASKGILVTTSYYGSDARSFAKDKPIELIDGPRLLYMLEEHGIHAKIEIPK